MDTSGLCCDEIVTWEALGVLYLDSGNWIFTQDPKLALFYHPTSKNKVEMHPVTIPPVIKTHPELFGLIKKFGAFYLSVGYHVHYHDQELRRPSNEKEFRRWLFSFSHLGMGHLLYEKVYLTKNSEGLFWWRKEGNDSIPIQRRDLNLLSMHILRTFNCALPGRKFTASFCPNKDSEYVANELWLTK